VSSSPEFKFARKAPAGAGLHGRVVSTDQIGDKSGDLPWKQLGAQGFTGGVGQTATFASGDDLVLLIGCGDHDAADAQTWRRVGVALARKASRVKHASIDVDGDTDIASLAQGIVLGRYQYLAQKSDPKKTKLATVTIAGSTAQKTKDAVAAGVALAEATCRARDWVNEPGGTLTPERFANQAKAFGKAAGLTVKVLGLADIKRAKLGGILGVNRGSDLPPRLVEMTWRSGVRGAPTIALVGKGITFDAGGLSIKSTAGMSTMKCDMGGGAAVIGAMSALPDVKPKVNVKAWIPMTDNMLGGDAMRMGDVLKMRNGKTVEVLNTDAEGRLILADGLSLASEAKPDAIIDLATLTGAAMVSLGRDYAALMSNNDALAGQVEAAADVAGELVWRLPLPDRYRKLLDSPIADMKNIGGSYAGSITAALFLREFVAEGIPWAHLDIAGPAFSDAQTEVSSKGGTGYGVRTLVSLIENFSAPE